MYSAKYSLHLHLAQQDPGFHGLTVFIENRQPFHSGWLVEPQFDLVAPWRRFRRDDERILLPQGVAGWPLRRRIELAPQLAIPTAMECPIAKSMELEGMRKPEETAVLGRMTTKINALPVVGEPNYFTGWPIERAGRRIEMAGTLHNAKDDLLVMCRLTFVVLKEGVSLR